MSEMMNDLNKLTRYGLELDEYYEWGIGKKDNGEFVYFSDVAEMIRRVEKKGGE